MKTCQTAQKFLRLIGISPNRTSFGLHELMHTVAYILCIMSLLVYLIYAAETAKESTQLIFITPALVLILTTYLTMKFKSTTIFKIFDEIEQIINKSG